MSRVTSSIPCWRYGSVLLGVVELLRCGDTKFGQTLDACQQMGWHGLTIPKRGSTVDGFPGTVSVRGKCIYLLFNCTMRFYVLSPAMCRSPSAFINHFLDPYKFCPATFKAAWPDGPWPRVACSVVTDAKKKCGIVSWQICRIFLQSNIVKPIWFKAVLGGDTTPHRSFLREIPGRSGSQGIL